MKVNALLALILSVNNDLIDTIAIHTDLVLAWVALRASYQWGNQSQILTLIGQLQGLKLHKGDSMEDYLKRPENSKTAWRVLEKQYLTRPSSKSFSTAYQGALRAEYKR